MSERRSPLKEPLLRIAGQSLQKEIDRLKWDEIGQYAMLATLAICMAVYECIAWLLHSPRNPLALIILSSLVLIYSLRRVRSAKKKLRLFELGRDGERAVAEVLDILRATGAVILHDIVGNDFNVDHVILSKHGIYAVETKTYMKWPKAEISYDGKTLLVGGRKPIRDPIQQAVAVADWVAKTLNTMTGKSYAVNPVVVFPGWYVRESGHSGRVWVLNPKQLPAFIAKQPEVLSEESLRLAVYFLIRYVRTTPDAA
jgi:hypothetical protein